MRAFKDADRGIDRKKVGIQGGFAVSVDKKMSRFSFDFFMIILAMVLLAGCSGRGTQPGTLKGMVKIGPIFPVERPGFNPPVSPQVFESRKVMIYNQRSPKLVHEVDIHQIDQGAIGIYQTELNPGKYTVDIKHIGIDRSGDVPKTVEIKPGEVIMLDIDIDIDTGIR